MWLCVDERDEIAASILGCLEAEHQLDQDLIWSDSLEGGGKRVRAIIIEKEGKKFFFARAALVEPKTVAQVLPSVLRPQRKIHRKLAHVRKNWRFFVGEDLARQMQPRSLRHGILTIAVVSESLRYEMSSFYAASLLETIRTSFPDLGIRQIRFILQQGNE